MIVRNSIDALFIYAMYWHINRNKDWRNKNIVKYMLPIILINHIIE